MLRLKLLKSYITQMEYLQSVIAHLGLISTAPVTPKVVAFGNVLLDHAAQLPETTLLERYNLQLETKGELDVETLSKITAEACESFGCVKNPGGSALNTVRILKALGTEALFFGAVGADAQAEDLRNILKESGIQTSLHEVNDTPTGTCICLVYKDTTTLYANIGASAKFTIDVLKEAENNTAVPFLRPIQRKQILYIEGYFVPHCLHVCDFIAKNYIHERRRLALNLSAVYIVRENFDQILSLAHCAYFIFGNRDEFEALKKLMSCNSFEEMAGVLIQKDVAKVLVVTNAAAGIEVITNYVDELAPPDDKVNFQTYNVPRVDNLVDTTGAGDAFVAGFLHAWLQKRALSECIRVASDVSARVCTQVGCNLPKNE